MTGGPSPPRPAGPGPEPAGPGPEPAGPGTRPRATGDAGAAALARLWWVGLPSLVRRVSASVFAWLLDGVWVFAFPRLAAVATPLALLAGLVAGAATAGWQVAPYESIVAVAAVVAVGTLSAHLGLALVTAMAVGDLVLAGRAWTAEPALGTARPGPFDSGVLAALARERLPLLIGYALLAVVAVAVPALVKGVLAQLRVPDSWPRGASVALSVAGHGALTWFIVGVWVEATPVLIRPMWTWPPDQLSARSTAVTLVGPLQRDGALVVTVAVLASLARMAVQWHVALDPARGARLSDLQDRLRRWAGVPSEPGTLRRLARVGWRTAAGTLLLAGLLSNWAEALVLAAVLLAASLVQLRVVRVPMGDWPATAARIPLLVRLVGALVLVRTLVQPLAERLVDPRATTFRAFLVMSVLAMLVFVVVLPAPPERRRPAGESPA